MRTFSSYGPVDPELHFALDRTELIEDCVDRLIGDPKKGGHFFTVFAPRQAGKTWLMQRAVEEIRKGYGDHFQVGVLSLQGLMEEDDNDDVFLRGVGMRLPRVLVAQDPVISDWHDWFNLFRRETGLLSHPLILLIDEFDSLTKSVVDRVVAMFRQMYLAPEAFVLHSLALIGVRAVLGVDSPRGSPFNVQRSLKVENFTLEEVHELFAQYQHESGQPIEPGVIDAIHEVVRGQPGLTCWLGELLTEKYNPGSGHPGSGHLGGKPSGGPTGRPSSPIGTKQWDTVYRRALYSERNNNVLNLIKKARSPYGKEVQALFVQPDIPFSVRQPWCDYLELNGIITEKTRVDPANRETGVCAFASPFVQLCLYEAFSDQLHDALSDIPALDAADALEDVFLPGCLDVAALLQRYKAYLERLRVRGRDPFRDQPMRSDFQLPEAVGHFHLYAWLLQAVGRVCVVTPEFPTGNGKVDLRIRYQEQTSLVEVKSLSAMWELSSARTQAARYAKQQQLSEATLALFLSTDHPEVVEKLEGSIEVDGVRVHVVTVAWRP